MGCDKSKKDVVTWVGVWARHCEFGGVEWGVLFLRNVWAGVKFKSGRRSV